MLERFKIIFILLLVLPLVVALNCSNSGSYCGLIGGSCASYKLVNGSCIPSTCPTTPQYTVWSNSSFSCVPCFSASKSICQSSCSQYGFYYDTSSSFTYCTTCAAEYGSFCTKCNSNQCLTCQNGFSLSSNKQSCVDPICNISHCKRCVNSTCAQCDQFYTALQNTCVCFIPNCQYCQKSICLKCHSGYYLDSSKKTCILRCISNCKTCTSLKSCTQCSYGYYYKALTNQCLPNCTLIDPYCQLCYTTGACSKCKASYTVSINKKSCIPTCADQYCNICTNVSKCQSCITGYKLNSSVCIKDVCSVKNCQTCASSSACLNCKQFYLIQNNGRICLPNCGVSNCQFCQSKTTCKTCVDGYRLVDGNCSRSCSIQNCNLCLSEQICFSCIRGFKTLNGQTCEYDCDIYKCLSCNSTTTCSVCQSGFILSSNLACIAVCQEGLFQNSTTQRCQLCPTNCASCDGEGKCLSCRYLYYFSNFTCTPCSNILNCFACESTSNVCTICKRGYYLVNGVCTSTNNYCSLANCLVCQSSTACAVCIQGYNVAAINGTCQKIICPSNQYLVDSTCTCGPRSYIENERCISCSDTNCLTCTSSVCFQCKSGYYASGQSCIACKIGCQTCDSTGCSQCRFGFIKKSDSCYPSFGRRRSLISRRGRPIRCMSGCRRCDLDINQHVFAMQAEPGYVLVAGNIIACDPSCLTCADIAQNGSYNICLSCPKRSVLAYGSCQSCTDANTLTCSAFNQSYSITCSPGYNAQSGSCKACSSNCLKCSSVLSGKCDVGGCQKGFFQSKGQYQCVKCFNGCTVCDSNPNTCLDCGDYKYLKDNICYSCPSDCLRCSNGTVCTTCIAGYLLKTDGTCKYPNINGCTEYDSNANCLTCDQYYTLSNTTCIFNMSCNNNKTCASCDYNYYLSNGSCLECPTISNCNSCDQLNSSNCIECASGFYLGASKTCVACSIIVGCDTCSSNLICTGAKDGYYLVLDVTSSSSGKVLPCGGLCATCTLGPLTCLSCKQGASFQGTQCISNRNYKIKYVGYLKSFGSSTNQTADYQVGYMIGIFPNFFYQIGIALGYRSLGHFSEHSNVESVLYQSIATSFSANADTTTNDPTTALNNAVLDDTQLLSLSVTNNTPSQSSSNLALILGICIPLGVMRNLFITQLLQLFLFQQSITTRLNKNTHKSIKINIQIMMVVQQTQKINKMETKRLNLNLQKLIQANLQIIVLAKQTLKNNNFNKMDNKDNPACQKISHEIRNDHEIKQIININILSYLSGQLFHKTDFLITPFQKLRFSFSLSSQSYAIRVKLQFIFFRSNYQYRQASLLQANDQKIYCIAKIGLLFFNGSSKGIWDYIYISEPFSLLVGSGGDPCLENQYRMLLLKSITQRIVAILSFSNLNTFLILFLNIQLQPMILTVILCVISFKPSKDRKVTQFPFPVLCRLIRFQIVSNVYPISLQDLRSKSQFMNNVSSCLLRRSYWISISFIKDIVLVLNFQQGNVGGINKVLLERMTSPKNLGRGTFSYAYSFFLNYYLVYCFLVSPQKNRTSSQFLNSSLLTKAYRINYSTIHLYLERIQGSFPSEALIQPSGQRQGSLRNGYKRRRIPLSLSKSENFLWMVIWQGKKLIWYNVQSPCKKLRETCYVLMTETSLMVGRGERAFYLAVFIIIFDKLIGEVDSLLFFVYFFQNLICQIIGCSIYLIYGSSGGRTGFCLFQILGGESGKSLQESSF